VRANFDPLGPPLPVADLISAHQTTTTGPQWPNSAHAGCDHVLEFGFPTLGETQTP